MSFQEFAFCLLFGKSVIGRLTAWDCVAVMLVILYFQSEKIIGHFFPKRPDLFKDVALLQAQMTDSNRKMDVLESDVTAMRVGSVRGGR